MRLTWERTRPGLYRGFSPDGHQLAQVGLIIQPDDNKPRWIVWLTLEQGELFNNYPTAQSAMAAAEAALDPHSD